MIVLSCFISGGNALTEIPPHIGQLKKLRELNIGNNQIKYLPSEILGLNLSTLAIDPNPFLPYPGTLTTPTMYKFEPKTIPTLAEFCLRTLLSPVPDNHFRGTASTGASAMIHTQKTWLSEKYDVPFQHEFLQGVSAPILHVLSACAPYCVPHALSPNITPHASPKQQRQGGARGPKRAPCVSVCSNPAHLVLREGETYREPVFVSHAEERFSWEKRVAGQTVGGTYGIPILWRGCSFGCLDYLQPEKKLEVEIEDEKDDEFDAQFMDVDNEAVFTSENFEFDDD